MDPSIGSLHTKQNLSSETQQESVLDIANKQKPSPEMQLVDTGQVDIVITDLEPGFDPTLYLNYKSHLDQDEWITISIDTPPVQPQNDRLQVVLPEQISDVMLDIPTDPPEDVLLDIPFYTQAPDGDRNQPRQDACEEASIILAAYGLSNVSLSKEKYVQEILHLVQLQNKMFGSYIDTTISETKELYDIYYGIWSSKIIEQPSIQALKNELALWHVIVAPFAGQQLWNPHYSNGWPRYHMMLLVWYNETHFVTHDVGTRHGYNYRYSHDVIMDSLHDFVPIWVWDISTWTPRVLVLQK